MLEVALFRPDLHHAYVTCTCDGEHPGPVPDSVYDAIIGRLAPLPLPQVGSEVWWTLAHGPACMRACVRACVWCV